MGDLKLSVFALICFVGAANGFLQEKHWGSYSFMHTYQTRTTPITPTTITPTQPIHPSITDQTVRPLYKPTAVLPHKSDIPDPYNTNYDAITVIENTEEIFIYKGRYFWRVDGNDPKSRDPKLISTVFIGIPDDIDHVDAVYERPDKNLVFFIGKEYHVFDRNKKVFGYARPITDLGLPSTLKKINGLVRTYEYGRPPDFREDDLYKEYRESFAINERRNILYQSNK